jgi:fatty acid desaturase
MFRDATWNSRIGRLLGVTLGALLIGAGAFCWGAQWHVFAACLAARWSIMSLLDNAPHYGLSLTSGLEARNTSLPSNASWLVMHQNLHGTHRGNPNVRWTELPALFRSRFGSYEGGWIAAIARQVRGPVTLD